mmetsp:Transcript_47964/g.71051  ORF Transcript_47964/g.71051 Transcript_47964/m.71051 type:complete len:428 (+) Transcript_47964:135-1418(+)|eukprot:CAMPEP_0195518336 /NCGR_PEP_ID=MMETSP0794_2-20130614/12686_1 /TAXON_ID=515487 /ORGANISM="Stephanopyxis turris, Strain CCMP 815" /LENGTH=427 /DNA_ID=CAMNT_0040647279 /DNA_START=123 /DNA_END=1406 /DNA_ORIENTATION=-
MLAIVSIAATAAVSSNGFGVLYGPGAGGFNGLGLHDGAQVYSAAYYWRPKPASDLMAIAKNKRQYKSGGCKGNYMGSDCSLRVCPYGLSANTSPYLLNGFTSSVHGDDDMYAPTSRVYECELVDGACDPDTFEGDTDKFLGTHTYAECSAQGVCDRDTGVCQCFDGYTGVGCRYTTCPNDCSGHGMCSQNALANTDYDTPNSALFYGTQYWDAYKTMRCVCDRGYTGYDCSERICPHGDDILTTCLDAVYDVQRVELAFTNAISSYSEQSKFFSLTFVDGFNGVYDTSPIAVMDDPEMTAALTQTALESLPNHALPSVQVSGTQDGNTQTLAITFSDAGNRGIQNDVQCNVRYSDAVCEAGQQPLIDSDITDADFTCEMLGHDESDASLFEENVECGNRGICDKSTGKCECFEGHTGEACDIYTVYV